ncbi:MAG TPA: hypothetical protein VF941_03090 [Clostridia bacterium]
MKYQITINQQVISETNLDIIDAAILDYLIFYCNSQSIKVESQRITIDGNKYTWIDYKTLIEDMPLLPFKSSGSLTPRIKKIEEAGYISCYQKHHQKLFIKLNSSTDELFIKLNRAVHETKPIKNTNIKNTIDKENASQKYLKNIPLEDIIHFRNISTASERQIRDKGEQLFDYCLSRGKKYKNYKAFLANALRKDYPKKSSFDEDWKLESTGA